MHGLHPFINKTEDMDIWMCLFVYCFCFELDISLPYLNSMNSVYKIPVFLKYAVWVPHLRGFEKRLFSVVLVFALFQFSFILWGILVLVLTLSIFFSLSEERLQLVAQFCFGITWFDWLTSRNGHLSLLTFLIFISNKLSSSSISCNDGVNKRVLYYM